MLSEHFSLKNYNTFKIDVFCSLFFSFTTKHQLQEFLRSTFNKSKPFLILGGGSNVLFLNDYDGTIIHPLILGITIIEENAESVLVEVGAGVEWDDFVDWAVKNNLNGVENLSFIPGKVGAAPVQNIGAYGVEAKDVIDSVKTIEISTQKECIFSNSDCKFGYRDSIFKHEYKNKHIVTSVIFKLYKSPCFKLDYGSISEELSKFDIINLQNIRNVIISIRSEKLPNPSEIGNAGSFFKNPIISQEHYNLLLQKFPNVVSYKTGKSYKIAAGWLIEHLGFKGFEHRQAKVHNTQALVLTNMGNAKGSDIKELASLICDKIFKETHIILEPEVIYL